MVVAARHDERTKGENGGYVNPQETKEGSLERGREAYAQRAWLDAHTALSEADEAAPLGAEDLELLATSASMVGRMDDYLALLERAHHLYADAGEELRAARMAGWIGMNLAIRGEMGPAGGWFGRSQRLVEGVGKECVEQGYLLVPVAFQQQAMGDFDAAYDAAAGATEIGRRFGEADLCALAGHIQGLVRIKQNRVEEGLGLLDEAMVAVTAGEVSPVLSGVVYCGVIACCEEAFEPRRAREWTDALARWCEQQPQMVAFTGRCLAHRAGIMQLHGAWQDALEEARLARDRCEQAMNRAATGQALYQQAELLRLQGDFAAAENAYREAHGFGREPQPGLAMLRLDQGDADAAAAAIRRARRRDDRAAAPCGAPARPRGDHAGRRRHRGGAPSLLTSSAEIAAGGERAMLDAMAAQARGAVELAEGDAQAALVSVRHASRVWQELEAPYEAARTRVLIASACRALGDADSAVLELEAARGAFEQLGASPDVARIDALTGTRRAA